MKTAFYRLPLLAVTLLAGSRAGAVTPSVCERTPQIRDVLVNQVGKTCDAINDDDLLSVTAIRVPRTGLTSVKVGDFAGLRRLEVLNLKRNAITALPDGIFLDLASLRVLVILGNNIPQLPEDFTVGNPNLEKIHMFANGFTSISAHVLQNLKALPKLNVLDVSTQLDDATKQALGATFPRENETVTVVFD